MKNCPNCHNEEAIVDSLLGVLPGKLCQARQATFKRAGGQIEFTSDRIKEERVEYRDDVVPMHRRGQLSKEWLLRYGPEAARRHGFTQYEIDHARKVWSGDTPGYYYNDDK